MNYHSLRAGRNLTSGLARQAVFERLEFEGAQCIGIAAERDCCPRAGIVALLRASLLALTFAVALTNNNNLTHP